MINNFLEKYNKIHMIGVGGISMSGFAKYLLNEGKVVSGSDVQKNEIINDLVKSGLIFYNYHSANNISKKIDLVVYSGAISSGNEELKKAKELKILCMERSQFLGEFSSLFKNVIAISGSHGKTTTTALLGKILTVGSFSPTVALGGEYSDTNSNFILGKENYFVCEACEYRESFKYLSPDIAVITNIEPEHLDYYKSFDKELNAFKKFAKRSKKVLIDENCAIKGNLITVGRGKESYYRYSNISFENGKTFFDVYRANSHVKRFEINLVGEHNVKNALFAIAVGLELGIDKNTIQNGLNQFGGVKRRNELMGYIQSTPIICDYAHHPTEIKSSISNALVQYKKIMCVFQPHTYSRTETLMDMFKGAFSGVFKLVIFKTYPAREKYNLNGSETKLFENVDIKRKKLFMQEPDLIKYIKANACKFDLVLVLGAGDIYDIVKRII